MEVFLHRRKTGRIPLALALTATTSLAVIGQATAEGGRGVEERLAHGLQAAVAAHRESTRPTVIGLRSGGTGRQ